MKTHSFFALVISGVVNGHYIFNKMQGNGINAVDWQYMRKVDAGDYMRDYDPIYVKNINTDQMRCNRGGTKPAAGIQALTVKAGQQIGYRVDYPIFHQGPLMGYMAKVPEGKSIATWDASGKAWFKIFQDTITTIMATNSQNQNVFAGAQWGNNYNKRDVYFDLPKSLPNGEYLFRVEHLGLHLATNPPDNGGGVQFFISCTHLMVVDGGTGTPGPLVEFPGAYKEGEPGITLDVYNKTKTLAEYQSYVPPGPPVWEG